MVGSNHCKNINFLNKLTSILPVSRIPIEITPPFPVLSIPHAYFEICCRLGRFPYPIEGRNKCLVRATGSGHTGCAQAHPIFASSLSKDQALAGKIWLHALMGTPKV